MLPRLLAYRGPGATRGRSRRGHGEIPAVAAPRSLGPDFSRGWQRIASEKSEEEVDLAAGLLA